MGVAATLVPKGLRPQKMAHRVELLGQPLSQKISKIKGLNTLPPSFNIWIFIIFIFVRNLSPNFKIAQPQNDIIEICARPSKM